MTVAGRVTGIVLAGGRASRFGGDKLGAALDGATVLDLAVGSVAPLVTEIVVAGPNLPAGAATHVPLRRVDDAEPFAGPLLALAGVLRQAGSDLAIVVGGDMPRLAGPVLAAMLERLASDPTIDAVLLGRVGAPIGTAPAGPSRRQVLPLVVRVQPAARAAREAVEAGQRALWALIDRLAAVDLPESTWLALDPEARTLLDVDTRSDLERIRADRS